MELTADVSLSITLNMFRVMCGETSILVKKKSYRVFAYCIIYTCKGSARFFTSCQYCINNVALKKSLYY